MFKFLFGIVLIGYGFFRAFVHDPVWGLYLFAALTHIRMEQLSENFYLPLNIPIIIASFTMLVYLISNSYHTKMDKWPLESWIFGFMVIAMAISSFQAVFNPDASWQMTIDYLKYWVFFVLMVQMINSFEKIKYFHDVLIVSAGWLVYRCWDLRGTTGARFENINGGSVADSNHFAAALVLLFPFVLQRILSKNKIEAATALVLCFGIVMAIFITGSRGGLLGLGVVLVLVFLNFKQYRKKIIIAIVLIGVAASPFINEYHLSRLTSLVESTDAETRESSAQGRVEAWKLSYELFLERPIYGVGMKNFGYYSGQRLSGKGYGEGGRVAHSLWFEALAEGGLLLFCPLVYMLIRFFIKSKKMIKQYISVTAFEEANCLIALQIGLAAFLVNATFLNRLIYEPIYWCIALGVAHEYLLKEKNNSLPLCGIPRKGLV